MQAITTKYVGPTETRGSRIRASSLAGSITRAYDHSLSVSDNHDLAARELADKFGWLHGPRGELVTGQIPGGAYVHVFTKGN